MRKTGRWFSFLLIGYLIFASMLYFLQEKMIFLPVSLPEDYRYEFNANFEEIFLENQDGARLNGLHFKSKDPRGVILYFHGNAGNLARWGEITQYFTRFQYDVVVMDYRTYGKSRGKLSESALYEDGQIFYDYVVEQFKEDQLIIYGRSLGTGIATWLGSRNDPAQIILETPYYSFLDIGQERFPYLPVKWMLKYHFRSHEYVQQISCPITIFHGTNDNVVPIRSGRKLFDSIPGSSKEMVVIEGGGHNNLSQFDGYTSGIENLLANSSIK